MKFTVKVDGVNNGLLERLTNAANVKLAPKLKRLAARRARQAHAATSHHSALSHPHPALHRTSLPRTAKRSPSHPLIATAPVSVRAGAIARAAASGAARFQPADGVPTIESAPDAPPLDLATDQPGDTVSDSGTAETTDGATLSEVSFDPTSD